MVSNVGHTAGPWTLVFGTNNGWEIRDASGNAIAIEPWHGALEHERHRERFKADALLLASALTMQAENVALKAKLDFSERRRESVVEGLMAANDSLRACDDKLIAQATAERDAAQAHAAEGWAIAKASEADALRYFNQCEALATALDALRIHADAFQVFRDEIGQTVKVLVDAALAKVRV